MDRPKYNGTYCATAYWSEKVGFQIEYWKQQNDLLNIPKGAARICYKDSIYENGWAQLELETQRVYPDWVQAYSAGILEGSLTWSNIYNQWQNTIASSCDRDENSQNFCTWLRDLLSDNYVAIKQKAHDRGERDHYWHQIGLYFTQLEGLETGYGRGAKRARSDLEDEIPFSDFLLMNAAADIQDLKIYFENYILNGNTEASSIPKNFFLPSATMLTKIFQNDDSPIWKLLFGHSTAGSYSSMLRIQKRYKFRYHFKSNQKGITVPGMDISFTGYPGILGSTDDFYIIKGRQVHTIVAGVSMKNTNLNLWKMIDLKEAVPLVARVMASNRISQNRRTWAKAMSRDPITGCKQWVTIDLNKMNKHIVKLPSETSLPADAQEDNRTKGLVWIVEQLPGVVRDKDVTDNFVSGANTTWVANGIPYLDEILEASAITRENFSLDSPDDDQLIDLEAVDKYLRTHGFRGDLLGDQSVAYGNIDIKLFSYNTPVGTSDYHAFAGPIFLRRQAATSESLTLEQMGTTDVMVTIDDSKANELEIITDKRPVRNDMRAIAMLKDDGSPFKWSAIPKEMAASVVHFGQPDEWNFEKVSPTWAWYD